MKRGDFVLVTKNLFEGRWVKRDANYPLGSVGVVLQTGVEDDNIIDGVYIINFLARDEATQQMLAYNFAQEELQVLSGVEEALDILHKDCSAERGTLSNMQLDGFNIGDVVYVSGYRGGKIGGPKQVMFPLGTPAIVDAILTPNDKDNEFMLGVSIQVPKNMLQFVNYRCAFYPEELQVIHSEGGFALDCLFDSEGISDPVMQQLLQGKARERMMGKTLAQVIMNLADEGNKVIN